MAISTLRADRLVTIGSLAVRPVVYRGANGTPFPTSNEPIHGLSVRGVGSKAKSIFHASTNVYGFLDLPAGPMVVSVTDPEKRYLPRTLKVTAPDQSALADALALGAKIPPAVSAPPFVPVFLRPSPESPTRNACTSLFGAARENDGRPIVLAWIRVSTPQGSYTTYTDLRGEYVAILPFLRPVVTIVDPGASEGEGDDVNDIQDTFDAAVTAHRILAPIPAGLDPLAVFPTDFDDLVPGIAAFAAVYETAPFFQTTVPIKVEAHFRLDLLSV
jgi:hypothetical protein